MQITVPSDGHFLITSNGEHIPIGARVDVTIDSLRYVNAILGAIEVGIESPGNNELELKGFGLWADDFTKRRYDESDKREKSLWGGWDGYYEDVDLLESYDVLKIALHTTESDIGDLYELATHGVSKDEFIERFKKLATEYEEI